MSKHTPGPWKIMQEDKVMFGNYRGVVAGRGYLDKQTNTGFNVTAWMSESDARLIACAPEMFSLLKKFRDDIGHFMSLDDEKKLDALLARIEGEK